MIKDNLWLLCCIILVNIVEVKSRLGFFHWIPFCMRRVDKQGVKTICIASNNCLASGIKQETSKQGQLRQEKQVGQYYYSRRSSLHATYTRPTFFIWMVPPHHHPLLPLLAFFLLFFFFFSAYQKLWEWNEDGSQDAASAQPPSCVTEMWAVVPRDFVAHLRALLPPG